PMFDHIVAAEIAQKDGLLTGEMAKVPPTGEVRAQLMLEWAAREGLDPSQGVAYADSASDLPMLEAVGYPVAVNPETRLVAIAEKRGWLTENWPKTPGAPNSILPMGPKAPRVTNQRGNN
ncbi:MAG: HAD-IB family hydrolase, partial [Actinobacteria bacterium]|nr:HAD-IB family hydrolase [Actinomycetota bacterium]